MFRKWRAVSKSGSSHEDSLVEIFSVLAQMGKQQFHVLIIHKLAIEKATTFNAYMHNGRLTHLQS
jgi:hypothetical protein